MWYCRWNVGKTITYNRPTAWMSDVIKGHFCTLVLISGCNNETHFESSVATSLANFLTDRNNQLYVIWVIQLQRGTTQSYVHVCVSQQVHLILMLTLFTHILAFLQLPFMISHSAVRDRWLKTILYLNFYNYYHSFEYSFNIHNRTLFLSLSWTALLPTSANLHAQIVKPFRQLK